MNPRRVFLELTKKGCEDLDLIKDHMRSLNGKDVDDLSAIGQAINIAAEALRKGLVRLVEE
jgi:hypothetical protein